MKQGWDSGTIEQLCEIEYGTRVVKKRDAGSKFPTYGGGGATFYMDEHNREDRMVIARFAMSAQCTRFVAGKFFLNDSGLTICPKTNVIENNFLNYQILSLNDDIYSLGRGTAQKNLNVDAFKKLIISYPNSIDKQKRIVAKLDKAFEAIDQAKANVERNLQNAKDLFQSELNEIFSQKGDGWVEHQLGDICKVLNGYAFKSTDTVEASTTQLLRMGNLYKNKLDLSRNPVYYPDAFADDFNDYILQPFDLVMSLTGTVGKRDYGFTVEIPDTELNLLLNQRIMKISIPDTSRLLKSYLHNFLLSPNFLDALYKTANGTRQANLSSKTILTLSISFPSEIVKQKEIVSLLQNLKSQTESLESDYQDELDALAELKKSILQKAFNGEL